MYTYAYAYIYLSNTHICMYMYIHRWVVLEAMAMGLPVISTAVGAVPSFVTHGETGLLLAPGETPLLLQAM